MEDTSSFETAPCGDTSSISRCLTLGASITTFTSTNSMNANSCGIVAVDSAKVVEAWAPTVTGVAVPVTVCERSTGTLVQPLANSTAAPASTTPKP